MVRSMLSYDPETGNLFWRVKPKPNREIGDVAGHHNGDGYLRVGIRQTRHQAHRLAWLLHYGRWPEGEIDHINRLRTDNRIRNLRDVDRITNAGNIGRQPRNQSGSIGVRFRRGGWEARIQREGVRVHLGNFSTREMAEAAIINERVKMGVSPCPRTNSAEIPPAVIPQKAKVARQGIRPSEGIVGHRVVPCVPRLDREETTGARDVCANTNLFRIKREVAR